MKNNRFVILLAGALLMSCTPANKDFYEVSYSNNYENGGYFKNVVVSKDANLKRPSNPTREGYIFQGWSTNKNEFIEFVDFDKPVSKDLVLYASWVEDNDQLTDLFKAQLFKKYLSWVEVPTIKAERVSNIIVQYYSPAEMGAAADFKDTFERYNDRTESVTYQILEDDSEVRLGSSKYYYDDKYFYKQTIDDEDSSNNKTTTAPFKEEELEEFLNIGFYNLNIRDFSKVIQGLEEGKTDDDLFYYDISEIDLRSFDSSAQYFEFSFLYEQDVYNEEQGLTLQNLSIYNGSIHFSNNIITKSKVIRYNAVAINGDLMMEEQDTDTIIYTAGDVNRE